MKKAYIFGEDWDYLIILDDCRFDLFEDYWNKYYRKGKLEVRESLGTNTVTFLKRNFLEPEYDDIVYITANPWVNRILNGKVMIESVWKDGWNEKKNTVDPWKVCFRALRIKSIYPDKKLIIHFLQPHSPYPNGTGECDFREEMDAIAQDKKFNMRYKLDEGVYSEYPYIGFKRLKIDKLFEGYKQNLLFVLPFVAGLINNLSGKIIVTSDHGEAFGEIFHPLLPLRVYGHPEGVRIPSIIHVPWLVIEK